MINYKNLIKAGLVGLMLATTPNLYAQTTETKPLSDEKKELKGSDLEQLAKALAEIHMLMIKAGQGMLRYATYLATTENGVKKPEVFKEIFEKLGISYFKALGKDKDKDYDNYLKQFEGLVIKSYGNLTKEGIDSVHGVLFSYFSPNDNLEYEKTFGIKPGENKAIEFKFD